MKKKRDRRPASEWQELVSAWRTSGESQRVFAEVHGVSASTLASWVRKLRGASGKRRRRRAHESAPVAAFSEVQVSPASRLATPPPVIQVTTPTGYVLRMTGEVDPASLRVLLDEVARC
jgi:transposase-like protein